MVVDKSQSQKLGDREDLTEQAVENLAAGINGLDNIELRLLEARNTNSGDGTEVFQTLANGLADVPPDRVAGAIVVTDGQIHDIPGDRRFPWL